MGESHVQSNSYAGQKTDIPCLECPFNVTVRNPEGKTKHTVSSIELEERLLLWTRQCEEYKFSISTGAIIAKRTRFDAI